jgi:hypothetical protein
MNLQLLLNQKKFLDCISLGNFWISPEEVVGIICNGHGLQHTYAEVMLNVEGLMLSEGVFLYKKYHH